MTKEQFKKKFENYWYYYKIHTIVAVVAIVVVAILVRQCCSRVEPDLTVLFVSDKVNMTDAQTEKVENMLAKYTQDVNKDGRKVVFVDRFYLGSGQDSQLEMALREKLLAEINGSDNTLFILDDKYYKQFNVKNEFFLKLNKIDSSAPDSYSVKLSKLPDFKLEGVPNLGNMDFAIRSYGKSTYNEKTAGTNYNNSADVLKKLLQSGGL